MAKLSIDQFSAFFRYYRDLPHQRLAVAELWKLMPVSLLEDDSDWIEQYRDSATDEEGPVIFEQLIGKPQLAAIWECDASLIYDAEIEEMNACLVRYDITTPQRMRHFLSQTAHESGGGRYKKELASGAAYEFREDLGNDEVGDGPKHKGAGYLQITGKYNYSRLSQYLGDPRVMEGVDYVAENLPFTSAGYWWMDNDMNELIDSGADVVAVTRRVNGGTNGLADRQHYYDICLRVI
jgi:putative chitinase